MKISTFDKCIICKCQLELDTDYDVYTIEYKPYRGICVNCPTYSARWESTPIDDAMIIPTFDIRYEESLDRKLKLTDLILHIDNWCIEFHFRSKLSTLSIWTIDYLPFYKSNYAFKTNIIPDIDFDNFDKDKFIDKIKTYILFS